MTLVWWQKVWIVLFQTVTVRCFIWTWSYHFSDWVIRSLVFFFFCLQKWYYSLNIFLIKFSFLLSIDLWLLFLYEWFFLRALRNLTSDLTLNSLFSRDLCSLKNHRWFEVGFIFCMSLRYLRMKALNELPATVCDFSKGIHSFTDNWNAMWRISNECDMLVEIKAQC